jgi:hypothetical protein
MGGCTIMDMVAACETNAAPGAVTSCISQVTAYLAKAGVISPTEQEAINACNSSSP